jgi:hypothetical protein
MTQLERIVRLFIAMPSLLYMMGQEHGLDIQA